MATYGETVRILQPIIEPIFAALEEGLKVSADHHGRRGFRKSDDPRYFSYTARRKACDLLVDKGIQATNEAGRPLLGMSGLLIAHRSLAVKVLRAQTNKADRVVLPVPGRSRQKQSFWRQDAGSALPGLQTDNVLLLWQDNDGVLVDPMTLVRPLGGDHRRDSLRVDWSGPLSRNMTAMRAEDLNELEPEVGYQQMGDEEAG